MEHTGEDAKKRKLKEESSNGSVSVLSKHELRALLDPLSKDQLVALLVEAGFQYPDIADDVKNVASKDPAHRKLFVRGLAWETTSEALRHAFEEYGEVEEGAVVLDKSSGKSRGFGFITFKHVDSVLKALKEPSKMIEGRMTVCNLAASGTTTATAATDQSQRKLYIGGLSYDTTNETLINVFSRYGEIEEGSIAYEKGTNKSRGFAFVTFKTVEAARKALEDPSKSIDGRHVSVKLAIDGQRDKAGPQSSVVPHVQAGYSLHPNIANYHRPQVPATATPSVGLAGYHANYAAAAYGAQPAYAAISGAQYAAVSPATQYGAVSYAQYGAGFGAPQVVQTGPYPGHAPPVTALPPYYTGGP